MATHRVGSEHKAQTRRIWKFARKSKNMAGRQGVRDLDCIRVMRNGHGSSCAVNANHATEHAVPRLEVKVGTPIRLAKPLERSVAYHTWKHPKLC